MNRRNVLGGVLIVGLVALVVAMIVRELSGPPANRILAAGDVRVQTRSVVAPSIQYPTMSYTVKVPSNANSGQLQLVENITTGPRFSLVTSPNIPSQVATAQGQPVLAGRLTEVNVRVGDHVTTGTVIAKLDTAMLDLGVQAAKLQAGSTKTSVRVLSDKLDTIADNQDKLATAKSDAFAKLNAQIDAAFAKQTAPLKQKHAEAVAGAKQLSAAIAQLKAGISHLPPTDPQVPVMKAQLKELVPKLAGINAFLKQWPSILKKLATAKAKAKAKAGSAINTQIGKAQDQLDTAKTKIKNARDTLKIIRDSADLGVTLAELKRSQATILSPCSGTVTQAMFAGQTAVVSAPIVKIAPDGPALVDTYLTAEQLGRVHVGSEADITYDSDGGKTLHAVLHAIDSAAPYPPTSFPTEIVHMTHAVKVTFQLDSGESPPAGTPVDIAIHTD